MARLCDTCGHAIERPNEDHGRGRVMVGDCLSCSECAEEAEAASREWHERIEAERAERATSGE